jgi:hypothetical protein
LIDLQTLELISQRTIEDVVVASLRERDGDLYAAATVVANCRLEKNARIFAIASRFELKTIFESHNVNSIDVSDFEVTAEHFVLGGTVRVFLPTAVTRQMLNLEELKSFRGGNPLDDAFWEIGEERGSAFVLAIRRDGTIFGDRVFSDLRNRSIASIIAMGANRFVSVGGAFGDRGWAMVFSLAADQRHFWNDAATRVKSFLNDWIGSH